VTPALSAPAAVARERYTAAIPALAEAWQLSCEPLLDREITSVSWEDVQAFPNVVATIKAVAGIHIEALPLPSTPPSYR